MTAKHTPGPWFTLKKPHGHCRIFAPSEGHAIARTYGPELNGIGVCSLTGPQNEADARLISAAPCLLSALQVLVRDCSAVNAGIELEPAIYQAQAAINKATGVAA